MQRRRLVAAIGVVVCLSVVGFRKTVFQPLAMNHNATVSTAPVSPALADEADARDAQFRKLIVGTWEDFHEGKRTMVVNPDGTLRLKVELTGAKAWAFVPTSYYNIDWKIEDGLFKKHLIGGEPPDKVAWVMRIFGVDVDERILELTEHRLLVLDPDGRRKYDWKRLD
ncbi:MAG: hypothetical protein O3A00_18930 [Planctomycetota bacterium]|nr:hypothetical protein [Planctomycetota bacterium]